MNFNKIFNMCETIVLLNYIHRYSYDILKLIRENNTINNLYVDRRNYRALVDIFIRKALKNPSR